MAENARLPSLSCTIFTEWNLTGESIRRTLSSLSYYLMLQVSFATVIGSTRFKMLERRDIAEVKWPVCGQKDSWEHCKDCYHIQAPGARTEKVWLEEIDRVMNISRTPNPALNEKLSETKTKKCEGKQIGKVQTVEKD